MDRNGRKTATYYSASFPPRYCKVLLLPLRQYLLSVPNHRPTIVPTIQTIIQTSGQTIVQKSCYLGRFSVNGSKLAPNCLGSFMILKVAKVFAPLWALFSLRMLANEHGIQQKIWLLIAAHMRGGL